MDLQISVWDSLHHITFESLVIPDLLYFRPKILPCFEPLLFSNRIFLARVQFSSSFSLSLCPVVNSF